MTARGHRIVAFAGALAGAWQLYRGHHPLAGAALIAGAVAGARAPDWLEMPVFFGGGRKSLIPHRTLTHWPLLWLIPAIALAYSAGAGTTPNQPTAWFAAVGFVGAAWLHLAADLMTPMGLPLVRPFGARSSLNWYRTGSAGEAVAVAALVGVAALIGWAV